MSLNEAQKKWIDAVAIWLREQTLHSETESTAQAHEIELRLGTFAKTRGAATFVSGVSSDDWHRVRDMFALTKDQTVFSQEPESHLEIIYVDGENQVRKVEQADGKVRRETKTLVNRCEFGLEGGTDRQDMALRLSHNVEKALDDGAANEHSFSFVRARARTTYYHKMWRIDLSLVQQGKTIADAETAAALYEIEIELLPNRVDWSVHSYQYLATSLFLELNAIHSAMSGDTRMAQPTFV